MVTSLIVQLLLLMATLVTPALFQSIQLEQGTLRGRSETVRGRAVFSFLGIPYAEAPVGGLRFKAPKRHPGWTVHQTIFYINSDKCFND